MPWLAAPPAPERRRVIGVFVAGFLLVQIAVPCTYYAGKEPTSERFAWRMFSSVHMSRWECEVLETRLVAGSRVETQLSLPEVVQESTLEGLRAGQLDLARKFLRRRLEDPEVLQVTYMARGTWPSGKTMPPVQLSLERAR